MKIAILGTRGIPNYYGGFEQFAEYLSRELVEKKHEVYVYNSHAHPYQESTWNGVNIIHKYDPEVLIGTVGQFFYDLNCILDSRKRNFDVILQLGYTSNSIWGFLLPSKSVIVTNMDGLEWKRSKYSKLVQSFLHYAEKLAALNSQHLIADSIGIQKYIYSRYKKTSHYIPYGANIFKGQSDDKILELGLTPYNFNLIIARLEPENNVETILDGVVNSNDQNIMVIVGNHNTKFGSYLKNKFINDPRIKFLGAIYDLEILNNLRYYSNVYFHGHSVGGTNPSLLEAMAAGSLICAHKNIFNSSILGFDALYFEDYTEVSEIITNTHKRNFETIVNNNLQKIVDTYSWEKILGDYEKLLTSALNGKL